MGLNIEERIASLEFLRGRILAGDERIDLAKQKSFRNNNWFTPEQTEHALSAITEYYLNPEAINEFISHYSIKDNIQSHVVALIPAGNIPLVGFHDFLCCYLVGKKCQIKLSEKDEFLLPALVDIMSDQFSGVFEHLDFVDKLTGFEAVIATGSNNTNRYFEHYFKDYPKILRRNRNSVAVLSGQESKEDMEGLADDAFKYFGLGCRSVSKIFVPQDYDIKQVFPAFEKYWHYKDHHKFRNNFEYNNANLLLNEDVFLTDDVFILKEDANLVSRISMLYYEHYQDLDSLSEYLKLNSESLQCVSSNVSIQEVKTIPLGDSQKPSLMDYADNVDTVQFLLSL